MASIKASIAWFKGAVARLLPPCKHIVFLLSKAMDRPLPVRDRFIVKTHLVICPSCQLCQGQLDLMRQLLRSGAGETVVNDPGAGTATLTPQTRERLKKLLSSANSIL